MAGNNIDKTLVKKLNYVAQNIVYNILISSFLIFLLFGPRYSLNISVLLFMCVISDFMCPVFPVHESG